MYRNLKEEEIRILIGNRCTADNWNNIKVKDNFSPLNIHNTRFSGKLKMGSFNKELSLAGGIKKHSGLYHTTLHNVEVGDDCCIENVKNYIANYVIGKEAFIVNVDTILTDGISNFGNGIDVATMSETGGRAVRIYDKLSSHLAYILALYRHRPNLMKQANRLIDNYVAKISSDIGVIGDNVTITDTGYIENVKIGESTKIEGSSKLRNGSLNSTKEDPIHIGVGVIANDFIVSAGASVEDGTILSRCFIGQACHLGHNYSASDSLFFSNSAGENGEACAIFAGPYTVTHHKSTLLIAGMFSFMNAGSGSNQSNHLYKLGPIHLGILERGSKTSSNSYILWPTKVGAFSLVVGSHVHHIDSSNLPFSYLIEKDNKTFIIPGANLRSVGTVRDAQKWPLRDRRKANEKLDYINFNILSPYTINKVLKAVSVLEELESKGEMEVYEYCGAYIKSSSLKKGLNLYRLVIDKFLGNSLISRLSKAIASEKQNLLEDQMKSILVPDSLIGQGKWSDLSGLIAPKSQVEAFLDKLEAGMLTDISQSSNAFAAMYLNYYSYEWTWAYDAILNYYDLKDEELTALKVIELIKRWKASVVELDELLYEDAKKEFSMSAMIGFGADEDDDTQLKFQDLSEVRSSEFESDPFVLMLKEHIIKKTELGDRMIKALVV